RRVKGTLHWVSAKHAVDAEIRLYDKLFTVEDPLGEEGEFTDYLDPDSLQIKKGAKVEPAVGELDEGARFQFERLGYFTIDPDTTEQELVINRTITLRDTWAKIQQKG
ncbi:MAG: glutamine--tRNA ligase, partial [Thermoplasmatota archaeon]